MNICANYRMDKSSLILYSCLCFCFSLTFIYTLPLESVKRNNLGKNHHKVYQEVEYDVTLDKLPERIQYFVRPGEFGEYEHKFEKIKDLGEDIKCKLHHGDCTGKKREEIVRRKAKNVQGTKKSFNSMLDSNDGQNGGPMDAKQTLGSPLSPALERETMSNFGGDERYSQQHNAAQYGQQPQMNLKMPSFGGAEGPAMGPGGGPGGPGGGPGGEPGGQPSPMGGMANGPPGLSGGGNSDMAPPGSMEPSPSNMFLQMQQNQANDASIQNSIQSKLNFMDMANKGPNRGPPDIMGPPGSEQMTGFSKFGSRDENPGDSIGGGLMGGNAPPSGGPNGGEGSSVSENDILKAEGIQPNEMSDLHNFLKSSNEVNTHGGGGGNDAEMTDGKFMTNDKSGDDNSGPPGDMGPGPGPGPGPSSFDSTPNFGKTNIDFGGHPNVENNEAGGFSRHNTEHAQELKPGGPEVPVLANLLGGPTDPSMADGPPTVKFVEQNTKDMMQSNSDYKLPDTAFSNLWKDYMSSTQSQLGQLDPSANSRETILPNPKTKKKSDVTKKRWKKSDVDGESSSSVKPTISNKAGIPQKPKKFMYIPLYVVKNLLLQASKKSNLKTTPEKPNTVKPISKSIIKKDLEKSKKPALYITERNGKRYLVVNPDRTDNLIKGFANVDSHYMSFAFPENQMSSVNGMPAYDVSHNFHRSMLNAGTHPGPFGFQPMVNGNTNYPLISGHVNGNGVFQGFMAVPIITRLKPTQGLSNYNDNYNNFQDGFHNFNEGYRNNDYPDFNDRFNNGYSNGYNNGYNSGYNGEETGFRNAGQSTYYPPHGHFQDGYANDPMYNFPKPYLHRPRNYGNTFMYGPAFYGNEEAHREDFERISMNQPLTTGHFYRDPNYDPSATGESMFQEHQKHHFGFGPGDRREIMNEIHMSGEDKFDPQIYNNAQHNVQVGTDNVEGGRDSEQNERNEQNEQQPDEQAPMEGPENEGGGAPEPMDMQDMSKRDKEPWVDHIFTKEHVGFGPITVEAKTADSQMKDDDDD